MKKANFVPALKFSWLTRFFDPFLKITMPEREIKSALIQQANIEKANSILDFGCGTATLTIMAKEMHPDAFVYGVDVDSKVLRIAKEKVNRKILDVHLDIYDGFTLPYKDGTFDKVISSLVFHHLKRNQKVNALQEIYRVLKNDGEFHIVDFGKAKNAFMNAISFIPRLLDGLENTNDNVKGIVPILIQNVGFVELKENKSVFTIFGNLSFYSAKKSVE